jgi:hypothetical protein
MENIDIFYDHLELTTSIKYSLWPFDNFVAIWYISPRFDTLCLEKSGSTEWRDAQVNIHPLKKMKREHRVMDYCREKVLLSK